jgi:uncharacterized protein (TIGR02391 family)
MTYQGWTLSSEEVTSLPVDELALRILMDISRTGSKPNEWNFLNQFHNSGAYSGPRELATMQALSEAMSWLRTKGLLARDPMQTSSDWLFITRRGHEAIEQGLHSIRAAERLEVDLHESLERKVRRQFLMGEYELAAFAAMKQVEVRVRESADASDSLIGTKLMRRAFGEGGVLRDKKLDHGEANALADLFSGAIGTFKNPSSHRPVEFDDPTLAAEVILLADLLLRMLDRMQP